MNIKLQMLLLFFDNYGDNGGWLSIKHPLYYDYVIVHIDIQINVVYCST